MIVSYSGPVAIASNLLHYLRDHFSLPDLEFAQDPEPVIAGWETFIYTFQLQDRPGLPEPFRGPLVLRLYSSMQGDSRLCHEFAAQRHLDHLKFPVARPLLLEEREHLLGGPFLLMERAEGERFLDFLLRHPWRIFDGPGRMARLQVRLHQLPTSGFPVPDGPFWERHHEAMRDILVHYDLADMRPGLRWLAQHRPKPPEAPSIVHLDFHPLNLMFAANRFTALLDWSESDIGDRHADVATSIVLMRSAPVTIQNAFHRLSAVPGRFFLRRWYLRSYRWRMPLDRTVLAYYLAWASFRRLCAWGRWLRSSPLSTGGKPSSLAELRPARIEFLCQFFKRSTGVTVHL